MKKQQHKKGRWEPVVNGLTELVGDFITLAFRFMGAILVIGGWLAEGLISVTGFWEAPFDLFIVICVISGLIFLLGKYNINLH